jgi:choline dehydrogenase
VWESKAESLPPVPRSQIACFWKSRADFDAPNFYTYAKAGPFATPENAARYGVRQDSWSLIVGMRPLSRGRVSLTGANHDDPMRIDTGFLSNPQDMADLKLGIRTALAIGNSTMLGGFSGRELVPSASDAELTAFLLDGIGTFWHQSSSTRMGRDEMSVVDGHPKVHGIDRLRVVDASVLPRVTTGNTMAPCVVIGESAANLIG